MPTFHVICQSCGSAFTAFRGNDRGAPRFCSQGCKAQSQRGKAWGWGKPAAAGEQRPRPDLRGKTPRTDAARQRLEDRSGLPFAEAMRSLYVHKGMSIGEVAAFADTGHRTARKWLSDAGIPQRTMSEDKALQMARLTPEERELQMAACREAVRGMAQSDEHRFKIARTKQDRAILSGDEATILAALNAVGLYPVPLYAIHRYNIDFGFPDIKLAVEYNGGNWHHTPKKQREDAAKRAWLEADDWTVVYFPRLKQEPVDPNGSARIALADLVAEVQRLAHR